MRTFTGLMACIAILAATGGNASGVILGQQNFDTIGPAYASNPTPNSDTFVGSGTLTNLGSMYDGVTPVAGGGMTFHTRWTDTRGNDGPVWAAGPGGDSGDFIGVNNFAGSNAPDTNPSGVAYAPFVQYNYEYSDGDGELSLDFDPVDTTDHTDVTVAFSLWLSGGFEPTDYLVVVASDNLGNSATLLSLDDVLMSALATPDVTPTVWNNFSFTPGLPGSQVSLSVRVDTNSGSENVFLDDVSISGTFIPEPASLSLLAIGALAIVRRTRKA